MPGLRRASSILVRLRATPFWVWLLASGLAGALIGLGGATFMYAQGYAYLSAEAEPCANCHIMRENYDAWTHSSHRSAAACGDCHAPHSLVPKYLVKGFSGLNHSFAFTFNAFDEPIRIKESSRAVARETCLHCHEEMAAFMSHEATGDPTECTGCHARVGHD